MSHKRRQKAIKDLLNLLDNDYEEEVFQALKWSSLHKVSEGSYESNMSCYSIASLVYLFEATNKRPTLIGNMLCNLNAPYNDDEARKLMDRYQFDILTIYYMLQKWAYTGDVPPLFNIPILTEKYEVLHDAAIMNELHLVQWLLNNGVNVDMKDVLNRTALHVAVINNNVEVVQELMLRNASLSAVDFDGKTPFEKALVMENYKIADFLEPNILCNQKMNRGETVFFKMITEEKEEQVNYLLKYVDIDIKNKAHQTALHAAAYTGNPKIIEILLRHFPDKEILNSLDVHHHSPLHLAVMGNKPDAAEVMLRYGAMITPAIRLQVLRDNFSGITDVIHHYQGIQLGIVSYNNPIAYQDNPPADDPVELDMDYPFND